MNRSPRTLRKMRDLSTAARLAALAAEDDPTIKERVEAALERLAKIEEEVASLVANDVADTPITPAPPAPVTAAPATISDTTRAHLADEAHAMPDGSFPIDTIADLKRAVQSFGRAKDPAAAKAFIKRRARALDAANVLPDTWD